MSTASKITVIADAMPILKIFEALFVNIKEGHIGGIVGSTGRQDKNMIDLLQRAKHSYG